jgi:DNA-3-methyladenine glycosylase
VTPPPSGSERVESVVARPRPDPSLRLGPREPSVPRARREFFLRGTRRVARDLLGAWLVHRVGRRRYGARIVEVEAYLGRRDPAAHSFAGHRSARVAPMFLVGGHLYVFFVYGMHLCANVVTREEGIGEAVLIRAAEGPQGADPRLLAGPAKLCRALAIELQDTGVDLVGRGPLSIHPEPPARRRIARGPRVGIDYAGEAAGWPLRYWFADSASVSTFRKSTRRS